MQKQKHMFKCDSVKCFAHSGVETVIKFSMRKSAYIKYTTYKKQLTIGKHLLNKNKEHTSNHKNVQTYCEHYPQL